MHGLIGHTQPRRIAARTVAARIAQELKSPLGHAVGYKVRFADKLSPDTYIKLMTDGILLAETQGDRLLKLRHDHHRRGARAQPQHRFPAGLSEARAAAAARSEADRHLGDDRDRALLEAFRRCAGHRSLGPHLSGRGALPPAGSGRRGRRRPGHGGGDPRRGGRARARARGRRHPGVSCRASAKSARPPRRCASTIRKAPRSCRCMRACRSRSRSACSSPHGRGASCWRPTSPRPRSPCPGSAT